MDPSSFSLTGVELGKLVLSSGLLEISWSKISEIKKSSYPNKDTSLGFKVHEEKKFTLVVFEAPPSSINDPFPDSTRIPGSQNPNLFPSLCSEKISVFSVHTPAFQLFSSACNELYNLKTDLLKSKKPVIITGAALGGSVASLFSLWLLETVEPPPKKEETGEPSHQKKEEKKEIDEPMYKRLLCITFGSPLIGDASLQQILENSVRNSCFLHVADAEMTRTTEGFMPFGTFLICGGSGYVCTEDPEAVMELLNSADTGLVGYSDIQDCLDQSVLSMAGSILNIPDGFIKRMDDHALKMKSRYDLANRLTQLKISMIYIEWYKKYSKEDKNGYYDQYRFNMSPANDTKLQREKKELNLYWKELVEEVKKKPQSDVSILTRRYLFNGNNYRRLVEPLDIAEYYRDGGKDYQTSSNGRRSSSYAMIEKLFGKESIKVDKDKNKDLSHLLMNDSCFWASVEEAMILINHLKAIEGMKDESMIEKLVSFANHVWGMIEKRDVSPEIFLEKSSFMKWWEEYKKTKIDSDSPFTKFMDDGRYMVYGQPVAA